MKKIMLVLVIFFFLSTFLCLSANSIVPYEDFLVMWKRAQSNIEINNSGGHSNIYTDTEVITEDVELNFGWIESVGLWGIGFNWFEQGVIPAIGNGYYDEDGIYIPTIVEPSSPGDNYIYFQLTLPPDPVNISPGMIFSSIGFYTPDNL